MPATVFQTLGALSRLLLVALLSVSIVGCTSMRAIEPPVTSVPTQVKPGDDVIVRTLSGKTYELTVRSVDDTAFIGKAADGKSWKIPYAQIESMSLRKVDAVKTSGLTIAVLAVVFVGLMWLAGKALGDALEDGPKN
ncbi:MAG TPA: hypothetical protein VGE57_02265 [Solimonas sp.]